MNLKKILGVGALIFALFFIVTSPQTAADITIALWDAVKAVFNGLSSFVQSL